MRADGPQPPGGGGDADARDVHDGEDDVSVHPDDTQTVALSAVYGAAGDGDGFLLTAAAPEGGAVEVIGRITCDPPSASSDGGLVLTLVRFGDDGVFHPESAADVDEALALVDARPSTSMADNITALVAGFDAARDDAARARDADADERADRPRRHWAQATAGRSSSPRTPAGNAASSSSATTARSARTAVSR